MIDAMALADELHTFCAAAPHDYPGHNIELFERVEKFLRATAQPAVTTEAWRKTLSEIKNIALTVKQDGVRDGLAHIIRLCIDAGSAPPSKRNWSEDASQENGNYECSCVECGQTFIGHKRRVICKACSVLLSAALPAENTAGDVRAHRVMTPESMIERHLPDVRCVGCGSNWNSADLAAAKAADPKIISCCPERKPLDITGWMARAIALEEKLRLALSTPTPAPAVSGDVREWRCFHCDEVFTDPKAAANHFGVDHVGNETLCQMAQVDGGIARVIADLAEELQRYRMEDTTSYREFYALGADHFQAMRREEEKGYARGLADGQTLSSAPAGGTVEPVAWLYEMALKIKPSDDQPFTNWKQMVTTTPPPTLPEGGVRNIVPLFASLPKTDPEPGKAQEDLFKAATRMRNILTSDGDPPTLNYPEGVEPDEFAEAFEALAAALQQAPGTDVAVTRPDREAPGSQISSHQGSQET